MTRKDFEAIAHILKVRVDLDDMFDRDTCQEIAGALSRYFATTNPRFDTGRFMRAAGF